MNTELKIPTDPCICGRDYPGVTHVYAGKEVVYCSECNFSARGDTEEEAVKAWLEKIRQLRSDIAYTKSIYVITALTKDGDSKRAMGWAPDLPTAQQWVNENQGMMVECLYEYLVIERCFGGIQRTAQVIQWYQSGANDAMDTWKPCEAPEWSYRIINWGIG